MNSLTTTPARDLSEKEAQERAELCFNLDQAIKSGLRKGREAMWDTAKAAHEFDEQNGWSALGYEKLGDWLADPEVSMTRSSYYRMVSIYRELAVIRQVPEKTLADLDASKVDIVLPSVKAGNTNLKDALSDVQALGARDLREKYIKRPDPATQVPPMPDDNAQAIAPRGDLPEPATGTVDNGDTPVFADTVEPEAPEPAQNPTPVDSGHLPVVEGKAQDLTVKVPDGMVISPKLCRGIKKLAEEGRDALARPDRLAPDRRARKEALENLILGLEAAGLA